MTNHLKHCSTIHHHSLVQQCFTVPNFSSVYVRIAQLFLQSVGLESMAFVFFNHFLDLSEVSIQACDFIKKYGSTS